jgi:transposase
MGQGLSADEVAQLLHVDRRSVYRWMERFVATGDAEALEDGRVQGALPKWDQDCDSLLETALAQTPAQLGYPANRWTVPVLQAFLAVYHPECALSAATVRRRLRALGYVWKRFRYVLAPDPEAEKKTPNPGGHPGFAAPYGPVDRG